MERSIKYNGENKKIKKFISESEFIFNEKLNFIKKLEDKNIDFKHVEKYSKIWVNIKFKKCKYNKKIYIFLKKIDNTL